MGQVRKRGNVWWIRYYRNGRRIEESAATSIYNDARELLKKREGAVADGVPITAHSTRFTFDDAVKDVAWETLARRTTAADQVALGANLRQAEVGHDYDG